MPYYYPPFLGTITIPIYDAPYTIQPQVVTSFNTLRFAANTFVPMVFYSSSVTVSSDQGYIRNSANYQFYGAKGIMLKQYLFLKANGYGGGTLQDFQSVTAGANASFGGFAYSSDQLYNFSAGDPKQNAYDLSGLLYVSNFLYPYTQNYEPFPQIDYATKSPCQWMFRWTLPFGFSPTYTTILPAVLDSQNRVIQPCIEFATAMQIFPGYTNIPDPSQHVPSANLWAGISVLNDPLGVRLWNLQPVDKTNNLNSQYETVATVFYNKTILNNFLGDFMTGLAIDGTAFKFCNTLLTVYYDVTQNPPISYFALYGLTPDQPGKRIVFDLSSPNYYLPRLAEGVLGTGVPPTSLCSIGFFWYSGAGEGTILKADGSGYYNVDFIGQTPSAVTALSYAPAQSQAPAIMCDDKGIFWLISNAVDSDYTYVGNGLSASAPIPTSIGEALNLSVLPIPCFNPCKLPGQK